MASRLGVNVTKLDDAPSRKPRSAFAHGRVRVWQDKYDTASGATAGDTVTLARLPVGSVVLGGQLDWEALTATNGLEVVVGDSNDSDRFLSTTVIPNNVSSDTVRKAAALATYGGFGAHCGIFSVFDTATGLNATDGTTYTERTGIGYDYTCTKDIIVTIPNGASTAGFIQLTVYYATE